MSPDALGELPDPERAHRGDRGPQPAHRLSPGSVVEGRTVELSGPVPRRL